MKNTQLSDLKQIYRQHYSEQKRAEYQAKKLTKLRRLSNVKA